MNCQCSCSDCSEVRKVTNSETSPSYERDVSICEYVRSFASTTFTTVSDSGHSTASSLGNSVAAHSIPLISFERFTSPGRGMVGRRWKKYLTFLLPFCRKRMPLVAEMRTDVKASLAHIDGTPWRRLKKNKLPPQRLQNSAWIIEFGSSAAYETSGALNPSSWKGCQRVNRCGSNMFQ